nr:DUF5665 domain-containing protein [Rhodovulum imhoffii]
MNQHRFIRVHNSIWRLMGVQVLRGLAMGFGTVAGGTIIVSAIAYSLSQIDFIPIIGDWASEIAREIQSGIKPQ